MLPIKETVSGFIIRRGNRRILVSQAHPSQMGCGDSRHVKRGYYVSTVREMIPTRKRKRWIYGRWGRRTREKMPIIARCLHNDTPPPQEQHRAEARSYPKNQPTGRGAIRKPSGGNHSQFYCVYRRLGVNCITIWLASNAENQPIGHELEQLR